MSDPLVLGTNGVILRLHDPYPVAKAKRAPSTRLIERGACGASIDTCYPSGYCRLEAKHDGKCHR